MDWKKLLVAAATALILFFVLWFFGAVFNPRWVYAAFAISVGVLIYQRMAWWEIQRVQKLAEDAAKKVTGK